MFNDMNFFFRVFCVVYCCYSNVRSCCYCYCDCVYDMVVL